MYVISSHWYSHGYLWFDCWYLIDHDHRVEINLGFYYHVPIVERDGGYFFPGYFGRLLIDWQRSLSD